MIGRFWKVLCACGIHAWSAVEPGTIHLTNSKFAIIGVLWAQVGTRKCTRVGCTAVKQVVREGELGYDDLCFTKSWGCSGLLPAEVIALEQYAHPRAVEVLATA